MVTSLIIALFVFYVMIGALSCIIFNFDMYSETRKPLILFFKIIAIWPYYYMVEAYHYVAPKVKALFKK